MPAPKGRNLYRYLDTVGNGTGTKNANTAADEFLIKPSTVTKQVFSINRIIVYLEDTIGFDTEGYGSTSALANGIEIKVKSDSGTIFDITDGVPIKTNGEWGRICYDVDRKTWGAGNECLLARFTFGNSGKAISLNGANGEYLSVTLNDSCTFLVEHYFMAQGLYL